MSTIALLVASQNKNLELAQTLATILREDSSVSVTIIDLVALKAPLYTPNQTQIPHSIQAIIPTLITSDALACIAPEYNGGIPPVFTNTLAWISISGDDWRACFNEKPTAIASFSGSGGTSVLAAMRAQLAYIGATVLGRQICATYQKPAKDESLRAVSKSLLSLL